MSHELWCIDYGSLFHNDSETPFKVILNNTEIYGHFIDLGNFHFVVEWPFSDRWSLMDAPDSFIQEIWSSQWLGLVGILFLMNLYFELRWSGDEFHANDSNQLFNLNFYCVENETVYLRTFERGSNETNACGTGATATGGLYLIQKYIKQQQSPKKCCPPIVVRMRGGQLKIDLKQISNQLLGSG